MLYNQTFPVFAQMLRSLDHQLGKADEWARANGVSEADLLATRLAPDMHPLSSQIRTVALQPLQAIHRLTGVEAPTLAEDGTDLAAMRALIATAMAAVDAIDAAAIDAAAATQVSFDLPNAMIFDLTGADYVRDWALPQFYFHLITAYALMRHRGVALGKIDYVGYMLNHLRQPA